MRGQYCVRVQYCVHVQYCLISQYSLSRTSTYKAKTLVPSSVHDGLTPAMFVARRTIYSNSQSALPAVCRYGGDRPLFAPCMCVSVFTLAAYVSVIPDLVQRDARLGSIAGRGL